MKPERFGLAKRPEVERLHAAVREFLLRMAVLLPWGSTVVERYGRVHADRVGESKTLASIDLLIALHARAIESVFVTSDRAFWQVNGLQLENWAEE